MKILKALWSSVVIYLGRRGHTDSTDILGCLWLILKKVGSKIIQTRITEIDYYIDCE